MIKLYFDGACTENPGGIASYGLIIFRESRRGEERTVTELYRTSKRVCEGPEATVNVAEYAGLLSALNWLIENKLTHEHIVCFGDSKLVIKQMKGEWAIKKGAYKPTAFRCGKLLKSFVNLNFKLIPRESNIADAISRA